MKMNDLRGLWRGKHVDNGKWAEGQFIPSNTNDGYRTYIIANAKWDNSDDGLDLLETDIYEVDPSTLGECTGLTDKNGKLIFEGDILGFDIASGSYDLVEYHNGVFGVRTIPEDGGENYSCCEFPLWEELNDCVPAEIIGNIHDNPELLKGVENNGSRS